MDTESARLPATTGEGSQEISYVPVTILGRGAFGEAVLYRRVEDNALVVWKEVDLKRLSDKERRDAQNEIDILSILNHANIVSYYNHFLDGEILLIEMEYANGGNLYQKIGSQTELFSEEAVLWYFYQVISAVVHIHEYGILHRDIKTLNIFMTKSDLIKLGDFGISKVLDNKSEMAESYVGTPYYMSPELIRGEQYNQKSDIWAAGCVLYELLTLTKVFDATNPLKLAAAIVRSDFEDISLCFTQDIRTLVHDMLNKDHTKRPTAEEVLEYPVLKTRAKELEKKVWDRNSEARENKMSMSQQDILPVVTSKSTEVYIWGGGKSTPQKVETFTKGKSALQVQAGHGHFAVLTVQKELYTWASGQSGTDMVGQLGHGDAAAYKAPKKVQALDGIALRQVSCGQEFTVCVADSGKVFAFGSDYYGCLGCDNTLGDEVCTPALIEFFTSRPVDQVSCGDAHVVALTREGEVYTWGCGEFGRLGLGTENDHALPQKVHTRGKHGIRGVHAGPDGTFLVKTNGRILACGSNEFNKLGLNSSAQGLRKKQISYDIPCKTTFTTVKPLSKYNIVSLSAGRTHTAVIDYYGQLIIFGSNRFGQLGVGDYRERNGPNLLSGVLAGVKVTKVSCGDGFTVAATADNVIYSWGLAENGRLGTISHEAGVSGAGKGSGGQCCSFPRTIFGSLHAVSDIFCCYWNSILVAEKVLAQKTIKRCQSSPGSSSKVPVLFSEGDEVFTEDGENGSSVHSNDSGIISHDTRGESSIPAWLQDELKESEFIPQSNGNDLAAVSGDTRTSLHDQPTNGATANDSEPAWPMETVNNSEEIPALPKNPPPDVRPGDVNGSSQNVSMAGEDNGVETSQSELAKLQALVKLLQVENVRLKAECVQVKEESGEISEANVKLQEEISKLQELVHCQADTIRSQAETIALLEDKNMFHVEIEEELWSVVDSWQKECLMAVEGTTSSLEPPTDPQHTQPGNSQNNKVKLRQISLDCRYLENRLSLSNGAQADDLQDNGQTQADEKLLSWDNLGSPEETKTWSRSSRSDMMKSFTPGTITKVLKGVTTTEEIV